MKLKTAFAFLLLTPLVFTPRSFSADATLWKNCKTSWPDCALAAASSNKEEVATSVKHFATLSNTTSLQFCENDLNNIKFNYDTFYIENISAFRSWDKALSEAFSNGVKKIQLVLDNDYTPLSVKGENPNTTVTLRKVIEYFNLISKKSQTVPLSSVLHSMENPMNNGLGLPHHQIITMLGAFTETLNQSLRQTPDHFSIEFKQNGDLADLNLTLVLNHEGKDKKFSFSLLNGVLPTELPEEQKWRVLTSSGINLNGYPLSGKTRYLKMYRQQRDPFCVGKDLKHIDAAQDHHPFELYDDVLSSNIRGESTMVWHKIEPTAKEEFNSLLLTADGTLYGLASGLWINNPALGRWEKKVEPPAGEYAPFARAEQAQNGLIWFMDESMDVFAWDGKNWENKTKGTDGVIQSISSFSVSENLVLFSIAGRSEIFQKQTYNILPGVLDAVVDSKNLLYAIQTDRKLYKADGVTPCWTTQNTGLNDKATACWIDLSKNAPNGFTHIRQLTDGSLVLTSSSGDLYEYEPDTRAYFLIAEHPPVNSAYDILGIKDIAINENHQICYLFSGNEIQCNF